MQNLQTNALCSRQPAFVEPKPLHSLKLCTAKHPIVSTSCHWDTFSAQGFYACFQVLLCPHTLEHKNWVSKQQQYCPSHLLKHSAERWPPPSLKNQGFQKFSGTQKFKTFLLKMLFCSRSKPQLKFRPHPDRSAEGNNFFPVGFAEILKIVDDWKTSPPHKLLAATPGDSSQHLPLSLQKFQDTVPVIWQGAETHHGAESAQPLSESQEFIEAEADPPPRNYCTNHFPVCPTKQGCCILLAESKDFWMKTKTAGWAEWWCKQWNHLHGEEK